MVNWKSVPDKRPGKPRCFSIERPPDHRGAAAVVMPERTSPSAPEQALWAYLYLPVLTGSVEMGSGSTTTTSSSAGCAQAATKATRPMARTLLMLFDMYNSCLSYLQKLARADIMQTPAKWAR